MRPSLETEIKDMLKKLQLGIDTILSIENFTWNEKLQKYVNWSDGKVPDTDVCINDSARLDKK